MSFLSKTLFSLLTATVLCSSFGYSSDNNNCYYRNGILYKDYNNFNDMNNNSNNNNTNNNNRINISNNDGNNIFNLNNNKINIFNNSKNNINNNRINIFNNSGNNINNNRINTNSNIIYNKNNTTIINGVIYLHNKDNNYKLESLERNKDDDIMIEFYKTRDAMYNLISNIDKEKIFSIKSECCKEIDNTNFMKGIIKTILKKCDNHIDNEIQKKIIEKLESNNDTIDLYNAMSTHVINRQHVGKFAVIKDSNNNDIFMKNLFDDKKAFGNFEKKREEEVQIYGINENVTKFVNVFHEYFQSKFNNKDKYNDTDKELLCKLIRQVYTIEAYSLLIKTLEEFEKSPDLYSVTYQENKQKNEFDNVIYNIKLQRNPKLENDRNKNLVIFGIKKDYKVIIKSFYNNENHREFTHYNNFHNSDYNNENHREFTQYNNFHNSENKTDLKYITDHMKELSLY